MKEKGYTAGIAIVLALTVLASTFGAGMVGAAPAEDLNYDGDDVAPNPTIKVDSLTVSRHPASEGLTDSDMAGVYDDNGDWVDDPEFEVNTTSPDDGVNINPYTFKPGHIDDDDFGMFPRVGADDTNSAGDENIASALDASEWSKSGANSTKLTISDSEVADGAEGVRLNTGTAMTAGDTATASYNNWTSELDSDESKRVLQVAADVDTLDSATVVEISITDESGDVKQVTINSSADATTDAVLADATGDSYVEQVRLNDLSTVGGGSWDNIESVDITVTEGDVDMTVSWLDLEAKGLDKLGTKTVDSDADGDYDETETMYDAQGAISVNSMETTGAEFDDATFNDVSFPAHFEARMLNGEQGQEKAYDYQWDSGEDYPGYDTVLNASYRMELPGYIDLSYSGITFEMEQTWGSDRFVTFGYAEGVTAEKNFSDVTLTSLSGNLGAAGDTVTIDDTVQADTDYVVTAKIKMVDNEKQNVVVAADGGSAPPVEEESGGIVSFITSIPGMLISLAGGFFGIRWLANR